MSTDEEPRKRRTFPVAPSSIVWRRDRHAPVTPIEALMQAAPGEDPEPSSLDRQAFLDDNPPISLLELVSELTERERWVLTRVYWDGRSLGQVAEEIGASKSSVHRWREAGETKIRHALEGRVDDLKGRF